MSDSSQPPSHDVSRRGFVGWAFGAGSAFIGLVVGIPLVGSVLGSLPKAKPNAYVKVVEIASLPTEEPTGLSFVLETQDAYQYQMLPHSVWVVKHSDADATVFSPVCTHLGCQVYWSKSANQFLCPCHGSIFTKDGAVVHGPAPRALDTLPSKIDRGALYVQWVDYRPGVPARIPV